MLNEKEVNISEILKIVPNRFMLSLAVAKRARQINEGAKPLIEVPENTTPHPILTALEEISQGKLTVLIEKEKDENMEMIEEVERYFEEIKTEEKDPAEESSKKTKKDKVEKEKTRSRTKSLAA